MDRDSFGYDKVWDCQILYSLSRVVMQKKSNGSEAVGTSYLRVYESWQSIECFRKGCMCSEQDSMIYCFHVGINIPISLKYGMVYMFLELYVVIDQCWEGF